MITLSDDKETYVTKEIDLSKVDVQVDDEHSNKIMVDETKKYWIIMKYLLLIQLALKQMLKVLAQQVFDMIYGCIHSILDGEKEHFVKDYTKDELNKFIESLDRKTFDKLNKFLQACSIKT